MKNILYLIICFFALPLYGQNGSIEGKVIFKLDSSVLPGAIVVIEGTKIGSQADINGNYKLPDLNPGKYNLVVQYYGYGKDTIREVNVSQGNKTILELGLPPGPCHEKSLSNQCPVDGDSSSVIPIVYGLPDKKTRRKVRKGKIRLGGCVVTGCEPYWYCKEHDKEF